MENALVKIDHSEYGLQATEAAQVEAVFIPMIEKMKELEGEFNEIKQLPIEPSTCARAKKLRLQYVKIRTGTAEIHKKAKAFYLNGGRFVDAWKNAQAFTAQGKENDLYKIENHFEILEAERKAALKADRIEQLEGLCDDPNMYPVADMSEPAFLQLLNGLKLAKEQREEAERKAEAERIENERLDKLGRDRRETILPYRQFWTCDHYNLREMSETNFETILSDLKRFKSEYDAERDRIRVENEQLKKEREEAEMERLKKEKELAEERRRVEFERKEAERKAKEERDRVEEKARKEKAAAEERQRKIKQEADRRLAEERVRAEKAKKEYEEQQEAQRRAEKEERERLEKIIADTIKCPHCSKEFRISEAKSGGQECLKL